MGMHKGKSGKTPIASIIRIHNAMSVAYFWGSRWFAIYVCPRYPLISPIRARASIGSHKLHLAKFNPLAVAVGS
jgi:hypothetical protein